MPKPGLWDDLNRFIVKKWDDVRIGFTELPRQMIFKGKFTLFRYALVVSQEMKKDKIDLAPEFQAGLEVVINSLTLSSFTATVAISPPMKPICSSKDSNNPRLKVRSRCNPFLLNKVLNGDLNPCL